MRWASTNGWPRSASAGASASETCASMMRSRASPWIRRPMRCVPTASCCGASPPPMFPWPASTASSEHMSTHWRVLQLADSAFPTGGFSHSAGLEAAAQQGEVPDAEALRTFVVGVLWQAGHGALPFLRAAYEQDADPARLDAWCDAF